MLTENYKKDEIVWLEVYGNKWLPNALYELPVGKAGSSYYTMFLPNLHRYVKFDKEGRQVTDYSCHYELWDSKEQYEQDKLKNKLVNETHKITRDSSWLRDLSLVELITLAERLGINPKEFA